MKRLLAGMTAALLAAILAFSFPAHALSAHSYILVDCATGRILRQTNANKKSLIASTTKIMTALLICERCNVLDRVRIPKEAVGIEGSSIYLQEGEILTIQELLYGMMLHSGNDAAVALALYCEGTVEGFSQIMNDKAKMLGMTDTNFENPHGLDSENHYSTAQDLAVLTAHAMENPVFRKIVSTKTVTISNRILRNHNKLLWMLDGAEGVKTGYTKAAGRILVSSAMRGGRRLIAVTISDPNDWNDHICMMESAFKDFSVKTVIHEKDILGSIEVAGGMCGEVELVATEDFSYLLAQHEQVQICLPAPGFVYAPISEGQHAGTAMIFLNGKQIGDVGLAYGETVEQIPECKSRIKYRLFGGNSI